MQKTVISIVAALIALVSLVLIVVFDTGILGEIPANNTLPSTEEPQATVYTIREYEGGIGVFIADNDSPTLYYEVEVYLLPEADRDMLKDGIIVYGSSELEAVIRDYTG